MAQGLYRGYRLHVWGPSTVAATPEGASGERQAVL